METAIDLIMPLIAGLGLLEGAPEHYRQFEPENKWGTYETLVSFVRGYLEACIEYPEAEVSVSR